jgi:hypothetical protein
VIYSSLNPLSLPDALPISLYFVGLDDWDGVTALRGLVDLLRGPAPTEEEAFAAIGRLAPDVATALRSWPAFPADRTRATAATSADMIADQVR